MRFFARTGHFIGRSFLAATVFVTVACSTSTDPDPSALTLCTAPRPQVCTMIYAPVCAEHDDGSRETLASACNACADFTVSGYLPQPCEELEAP